MQGAAGNVTTGSRLFNAQTWAPRVKCPACLCAAVEVTRTMPIADGDNARVRYHRCRICGALFKSVEDLALSTA
jgi:hypothetical protein